MSVPLLSIVVPVYGVEPYIEDCVRSLFAQTLDDIEYIFIDDCTPDNSIAIIEKVLQEYPNRKEQVKFIYHSENKGLARTREDGIKAATGKYITSCDSDDWVDVEMYEQMIKKAQKNDAQLVICDMIFHKGNDTFICNGGDSFSTDLMSDMLSGKILTFIPSCVFDRCLYDESLLMFAGADMAEDLVISVSLAYYSTSVVYIEQPYYHYRINDDSISKKKNISSFLKRANDIKENTDLIISFLCQHGLEKKYEQEILLRKHIVKNSIWPVVGNKMAYHLWRNLYPEIHYEILRNRNYSFRTKLLYVLTILGIYPIYLKLTKK